MTHDDTLHEELTAYLDGELSPEHRRQVEERIAREPEYRAELQRLERAWDFLDQLPRATVDDSFHRTTIEMVAVVAEADARERTIALPKLRRRRMTWSLVATLAAAVLGFVLGLGLFPNHDRQLLNDLPVIENYEAYRHAESIEFLRKLDESGLFSAEEETHDR